MTLNCTATPNNIGCILNDTGQGMGGLFDAIAVPIGTFVIVLTVAGAVGAILYGVAKGVANRT